MVSQTSVQMKLFLWGDDLKVTESKGSGAVCVHTSPRGLRLSVSVLGSFGQRGSSGEDVEMTVLCAMSKRGLLLGSLLLNSHAITIARTKISET